MLSTLISEVLNRVLDNNIFSVECGYSIINQRPIVYITVRQLMTEKEFINKTKGILSENDISFSDQFHFNIDLTADIINSMIKYTKGICLNEFEELKK